jgi:hypothetical protein
MKARLVSLNFIRMLALLAVPVAAGRGQIEEAEIRYPRMAPMERYLMDRNEEIAMAQSAAPAAISRGAEVLVLGRLGYETALKGTNGFVCMVERSWTSGIDEPEFWNPNLRAPICFNPPAVRSHLPLTLKKTALVLAGLSKDQLFESLQSSFDKRELPIPEAGSMCYMMSRQAYFGERYGHWIPHLMFFVPQTDVAAWGASLPGSPIMVFQDPADRLTVFMIPVAKWSDGSAAPSMPGK